jgi:hypothetical protein
MVRVSVPGEPEADGDHDELPERQADRAIEQGAYQGQ